METEEQLRFVVRFANLDLRSQREGDWLNLQDDLKQFFPTETTVPHGGYLYDTREDSEYEKYPKPKIVALQQTVKDLLKTRTQPPYSKATLSLEVCVKYDYIRGFLNVSGKFRDIFLHWLLNILIRNDDEGESLIRECAQCGRFFLRVRRQVHCSAQCADRANYEKKLAKETKRKGRSR